MAEKDRSTVPAVSTEPPSIEEIIEAVRQTQRECLRALQSENLAQAGD